MEILEKIKKKESAIKKILGTLFFLIILGFVFSRVTYLFRNTGTDREHVIGIENEDVDMVYIGGSAAFVYWQPLRAWNDFGITSYNLATNSVQAESLQGYIEEAQRTQNPDLFVIGIRAFQYYTDDLDIWEPGIRNASDSMDILSPARISMLKNVFKYREKSEETDWISYYLDIAKYHTNTSNLASESAWKLIENNHVCPDKGFEWIDAYDYVKTPKDFLTDERGELEGNAQKILTDLLDYCRDEKLNVLFVVCPYAISSEDQKKYNTMKDLIESYGFNYLNANEYLDEIGISFDSDFYNVNHVNPIGAKKYTEFLEKYIVDHYSLVDHRNDKNYESWIKDGERFLIEEETHLSRVKNLQDDFKRTEEITEQMVAARSIEEWMQLASGTRYTLLCVQKGPITWTNNIADEQILLQLGLNAEACDYITVIYNNQILNTTIWSHDLIATGNIDHFLSTTYEISIEDEKPKAKVGDENFILQPDGMSIIVFDNGFKRVMGIASIGCGEDGKLTLNYEKVISDDFFANLKY